MEYTRLGKTGLKVSKVILGCMSYGNSKWEGSPWILDEEESLRLIKKAYDIGINTWDTADTYSNGRSEEILGKALKEFNIPRSKVVIMTKVYALVLEGEDSRPKPVNDGIYVNQIGLSRKHIFDAVDASLRRLGTDYIDVLQTHRLDHETEPEEIMEALHDVVKSGKVRYIGGSTMYTWEFARLQTIALVNRWTPFVAMQGFYNLLYREEEREMNPFCKATGVGLIPWSPLGRGLLARPRGQSSSRGAVDDRTQRWFADTNPVIIDRVEQVAAAKKASMAAVATAWVIAKGCCPIIGLSKESQLDGLVEALHVELTDEEMKFLEEEYRPLEMTGI
ncbi:Aldo/keto reductase [Neofusicoccum parvum]|uniref:Aldo/keto reductase n=1 Tax=Neofusicoccum parvum TaxID=310453 RepID=A0ACB5RXR3_9PEZI|nr:Aldo/keto reductase [Neofusicoccum parvum]GME36340.1 Aldo/keto reductase [Neofusicoccum parvum]